MTEKEQEIWTSMLELYKELSYLWDKTNKHHLNRYVRQGGYQLLLKKYRVYDKSATIGIIKKKIGNMRTTYFRELKKVNKFNKPGCGIRRKYVPKLWYYDLLNFLADHAESKRENKDNLQDSDEDSQKSFFQDSQKSFSQDMSIPGDITPNITRKKQQRTFIKKRDEYLPIQTVAKLTASKPQNWEVIGKSIGIQLKDIDERQLTIAHKLISDTIFYAKTRKLCEESSISLHATNRFPATRRSSQSDSSVPHYLISLPRSSYPVNQNHFATSETQIALPLLNISIQRPNKDPLDQELTSSPTH